MNKLEESLNNLYVNISLINNETIRDKSFEDLETIRKELAKPQELYNKIKEKRDNARLIREEHARKQDISDEEKSEICAEICTYNDVLLLMENMFVINMFEGLENE